MVHSEPRHIFLNGYFPNGSPYIKVGTLGLDIESLNSLTAGDYGAWLYTVPRYFTDPEKYKDPEGKPEKPSSFITKMTLWNLLWQSYSGSHPSPYLSAGLWDPEKEEWKSNYLHEGGTEQGLTNLGYHYEFKNKTHPPQSEPDVDAKVGEVSLVATETQPNSSAYVFVGDAAIELGDKDAPTVTDEPPLHWVNQEATTRLPVVAKDTGLGVYAVTLSEERASGRSWKTQYGCKGVGDSACPRVWNSGVAGQPALIYEPALLPEGLDTLKLVAEDPVGNKSSLASAEVDVDHTAPKLAVSGSITEQATLGTKRPTYALNYTATDGEAEAATALSPFGSAEAGNMQMKRPFGIATDKNGHVWMVDREANCVKEFDEEGHFIRQFGSTGSGNGQLQGPSDIARTPSGNLWVTDTGNHRVEEFGANGEYLQQFKPSTGSGGSPEFSSPFGIAIGPNEMLWIGDSGGNRVGEFRETVLVEGPTSRFVRLVSGNPSSPSGSAELSSPAGLAVDSHNDLWVSDYGHNRIQEFDPEAHFMMTFGSEGGGNGQLKMPYNIAIAPSGNLLITDSANNRIEEFQPNGAYLRQFGSTGTANGQFSEPRDLALGANGTLFVADAANHRITRWAHPDYDPQSGVIATEVKVDGTQLKEKYAPGCAIKDCVINREWKLNSSEYSAGEHTVEVIATDGVGLQTTRKLSVKLNPSPPAVSLSGTMTEQPTLGTTRPKYKLNVNASAEAGLETPPALSPSYASAFGSAGTGNGQFSHPGDIALDGKGHLWVADENDNRLEEFGEAGEYLAQFGSTGPGNGQFNRPTSIAIDPKGHLWVTDAGNRRVQEFSEAGAYMAQFGSLGTGNGQFSGAGPEGIAIDQKGNIWVSDTYGARIEEFSEAGTFIKAVGTRGSAQGQLVEPTGIDVGPGGNVWVTDWANNRVEVYSEVGAFVRQFGTDGTANGQFKRPDALTIDTRGDVWVGDQNNERVQEFNQAGEYVGRFGSAGSGAGQFNFGFPLGIAINSKGSIWVTDTGNNRVQKWTISGYGPSYASSFGLRPSGCGK